MGYVEYIKVGSGESWPVRDAEAHEKLTTLEEDINSTLVPTSRTINGKALNADITLYAEDIEDCVVRNEFDEAMEKVVTQADYIVETGTSDIWTYEKWNSGKAVCWGIKDYESTEVVAWGSCYQTPDGALTPVTYPFAFVEEPVCTYAFRGNNFGGWVTHDATQTDVDLLTYAPPVIVVRPNSTGSGYILPTVMYHAIGKWK